MLSINVNMCWYKLYEHRTHCVSFVHGLWYDDDDEIDTDNCNDDYVTHNSLL